MLRNNERFMFWRNTLESSREGKVYNSNISYTVCSTSSFCRIVGLQEK